MYTALNAILDYLFFWRIGKWIKRFSNHVVGVLPEVRWRCKAEVLERSSCFVAET